MGNDKKFIFIFSLAILTLFAFLRSSYIYTTIVDDAYIFFRFAENIYSGYGIIWNVGENVVEGYSSFLYLALLLGGKLFSFDLEVFSIIIGILCSSIHLYISYLIYNHFYPHLRKENKITLILILLSPAYLYWSAAGMETGFYSMCLLLSIYGFLLLKNSNKLLLLKGVIFGILCLVRYEAILFFLFAALYLVYINKSKTHIQISKTILIYLTGFAIIFLPYFLWRWNYFEYLLPNTFYAKTGGGFKQIFGGFVYTALSFRLFYGLFWIVILLVLTQINLKLLSVKAWFVFGISIVSVLTTIYLGGDHFSYGRFFIPTFPLLFFVFPPALNKFLNSNLFNKYKNIHKITFLSVVFTVVMISKLPYQQMISGVENLFSGKKDIVTVYDSSIDKEIIEWEHGFALMGQALKDIAQQNECIAAIPVGIISYETKMKVLDMVGIVNPVIAHRDFDPKFLKHWIPGHNKGDGKYILSKKPDYIQLVDYITSKPQRKPGRRAPNFKSIQEIWESPTFHKNYKYICIEVAKGWYYNLYKRISD